MFSKHLKTNSFVLKEIKRLLPVFQKTKNLCGSFNRFEIDRLNVFRLIVLLSKVHKIFPKNYNDPVLMYKKNKLVLPVNQLNLSNIGNGKEKKRKILWGRKLKKA